MSYLAKIAPPLNLNLTNFRVGAELVLQRVGFKLHSVTLLSLNLELNTASYEESGVVINTSYTTLQQQIVGYKPHSDFVRDFPTNRYRDWV